ncbi:type I polyketide synthase [Paenibacillus glacialis]|uniref:Ketosynthase family 3 (KS3) domain-containing protein n=1 Tax=Paenibacillus glacialis TaxID=494026 RepID=A0A168MJG7_9BACL|nr:beta-ketoacyl synthase N-terminal-like domain-containing protein [Paenibacillus glacialis]OAB44755.1 hypothetical protein PGLA_04900 [Paenibacillus glacialis]
MNKIAQSIFENILSGNINKAAGAELLKLLKTEQISSPADIDVDEFAIVGMSARLPEANDLEQFWTNLRNGTDSIGAFPEARRQDVEWLKQFTYMKDMDVSFTPAGYLDRIDHFDYKFFGISPKEASLMDPNQRIFLEVAWNALEDAGYGGKQIIGSRTGLYIGYSGWPMYGNFVSHVESDDFEMSVAGNITAIIASRIPHLLDLKGPSLIVDTACSSSLVALHLACQALRNNECEQALVGGIRLNLLPLDGFIKYGIESGDSRAKTFDDHADGTALSEGVTAIFIKPLSKAIRDGDDIYAVIKGSATNQDGNSINITAPNALAQEDVIVRAWNNAKVDPTSISYIEAHGTGTILGDPIEIDGIQKAFRRFTDKKQFCAIGSVKSNIGHIDAAAGLAGVIKSALSLHNRELPPSLHFNFPNRKINFERSPVFVNDRWTPWATEDLPRRCGVSSFGFSGTNCHVVLEEAPAPVAQTESQSDQSSLFTLSAKSRVTLEALVDQYIEYFHKHDSIQLNQLCYTSSIGRGHYSYRLAIVISSTDELYKELLKIKGQRHEYDNGPNRYYGYHRVIANKKTQREETDYLDSEIRAFSAKTSEMILQNISQDNDQLLLDLAQYYVRGAEIDWDLLYTNRPTNKLHLPVYPFEKTRCWLTIPEVTLSQINELDRESLHKESQQSHQYIEKADHYVKQVYATPWPRLGLSGNKIKKLYTIDDVSSLIFAINGELNRNLRRLASECDTTLSAVLLAAYQLVLAKYAGQEDIVVGVYAPTSKPMIGDHREDTLTESVAIRNYPNGYKTFEYFLKEVTELIALIEATVRVPLSFLLATPAQGIVQNETPMYEAMFDMQQSTDESISANSVTGNQQTGLELVLLAVDKVDGIEMKLSCITELYPASMISRFEKDYEYILELITDSKHILLQDVSLFAKEIAIEHIELDALDLAFD